MRLYQPIGLIKAHGVRQIRRVALVLSNSKSLMRKMVGYHTNEKFACLFIQCIYYGLLCGRIVYIYMKRTR